MSAADLDSFPLLITRCLLGCELCSMFYDSHDHYALALEANSKILRIDGGNKNYLLPVR